jgi:molybdopterin biosynthesis enzyme
MLPIARDTRGSLAAALDAARGADLIVTLGGASVGDHDLVREVFGQGGLELSFYRINMRPGKPLMAGRIAGGPPMIGLPGNPVSAMVCGHLFLRPALDAFAGLPAGPLPRRRAPLAEAIGANGGREPDRTVSRAAPRCGCSRGRTARCCRCCRRRIVWRCCRPIIPRRRRGSWLITFSFETNVADLN